MVGVVLEQIDAAVLQPGLEAIARQVCMEKYIEYAQMYQSCTQYA